MDNLALIVGVLAVAAVIWWVVKGLLKLALLAAVVGAVAWFWYLS